MVSLEKLTSAGFEWGQVVEVVSRESREDWPCIEMSSTVVAGTPQFFWFGYTCDSEEDIVRRKQLMEEHGRINFEPINLKSAEEDKANSLAVYVNPPSKKGFNNVEYFSLREIKRIVGYRENVRVGR